MLNKKNRTKSSRGHIAAIISTVILSGIITVQSCKQEQPVKVNMTSPNVENSIGSDEEDVEWYGPAVFYEDDSLRTTAYKMPEFKGNLMQYIIDNIKYPKYAWDNKIEGKVIVKFIVDKNGEIAQKQILSSPDDSLSQSVIDMLYNMPTWKPGEDEKGKNWLCGLNCP